MAKPVPPMPQLIPRRFFARPTKRLLSVKDKADSERDRWLTAEEAQEYGLIDKVIYKR